MKKRNERKTMWTGLYWLLFLQEKKYEENNKPGDPDPEKLPNLGVSGRARARLGTF